MLVLAHLSKFFAVEFAVYRFVAHHAAGCLNHVIMRIAVASFVHWSVFPVEFTGLVFFPDNATVFGKGIMVLKTPDSAHFRKDAAGIYFADSWYGAQDLVLRGIKPFHCCKDGIVNGFQFFLESPDAVSGS